MFRFAFSLPISINDVRRFPERNCLLQTFWGVPFACGPNLCSASEIVHLHILLHKLTKNAFIFDWFAIANHSLTGYLKPPKMYLGEIVSLSCGKKNKNNLVVFSFPCVKKLCCVIPFIFRPKILTSCEMLSCLLPGTSIFDVSAVCINKQKMHCKCFHIR